MRRAECEIALQAAPRHQADVIARGIDQQMRAGLAIGGARGFEHGGEYHGFAAVPRSPKPGFEGL